MRTAAQDNASKQPLAPGCVTSVASAPGVTATTSAVIFDFDGTLVDTMPVHYEAYRQAFAAAGIDLSREDFFGSIGGNARETIPKMLRGRSCSLSIAELHANKKRLVNDLFASGPIQILETAKLLEVFAGRLPMALASSGSRAGIEILLARFGWQKHFKAVICGEDALHGKPAPDLFLLAAERLGVRPAECIVFEDTDAGVAAAVNAGMRPFDVRLTRANSAEEFGR